MPGISSFPLHLPTPPTYRLPPGKKIAGEVNPIELEVICHFCTLLKPRRIFEIGTFRGRTTLGMAMNMDEDEDSRVFTLDLLTPFASMEARDRLLMLDREEIGAIYRTFSDYPGKIVQLFGNSKRFNFAPYHGMMDLVFVDGSHDFWSVVFDLYNAKQMVTEAGTIICHDYAPWEKGVQDAASVFCWQYNLTGVHIEGTALVGFGKNIIDICFPNI